MSEAVSLALQAVAAGFLCLVVLSLVVFGLALTGLFRKGDRQ